MLNGSPNLHGCTYTALSEIGKTLNENGVEYEIFQIGAGPIRDCIGCDKCRETGCIFTDDKANEFLAKAKEADAFVFGTPVYYSHPTGRILSFLDRVFFSGSKAFSFKPGAAVASARRAGTSSSLDVLNKYFQPCRMITVGSTYWNEVHGFTPEDVHRDKEGMQTMRNLGRNLSWILKCIEAGKKAGLNPPELERGSQTNFID